MRPPEPAGKEPSQLVVSPAEPLKKLFKSPVEDITPLYVCEAEGILDTHVIVMNPSKSFLIELRDDAIDERNPPVPLLHEPEELPDHEEPLPEEDHDPEEPDHVLPLLLELPDQVLPDQESPPVLPDHVPPVKPVIGLP